VDFFEDAGTTTIAAYDVESRERAKSYGLVELDGTEVVSFQEKPDDPNSTLVSIACYAYPRETLELFDTYLSNDNNPDEPGWFVQWLQSRGTVNAFTFDGAWFDIGTPEAYLDTVEWKLDGDNVVHDGATVENTDLGGNVHVMDGASVTDSSLSNTVVFPNATITDSDLDRSIVDEETEVSGLNLAETLVGAYSELSAGE
jgi:glucose-1-phosphate thymidylyltransferase